MKKTSITLTLATLMSGTALAADISPNWLQHAAISPNGDEIAFSYRGDIYKVPVKGGTAVPLTVNAAWEGHPVWSKDGKTLAFASDRNGNLDVYVMRATGGDATRLTFHSADDIPSDFTEDSKSVLFQSARLDDAASSQFPASAYPELYSVGLSGGTPVQLLTLPAVNAHWNKGGDKLIYQEEKGRESDLRKHDRSAFARDVWMYDPSTGAHTQLTTNPAGDQEPVWGRKDDSFYFLSDRSGTFNVWAGKVGSDARQLTDHSLHAVRSLSAAKDDTLAYLYFGDLYTVKPGRKPKAIEVTFANDGHGTEEERLSVAGRIGEFAVSPNGKEIAFVSRGDVFVTSTEFATTTRITDTPGMERSVSFTKDGDGLLYAAERDGKWRIMETNRKYDGEKYFFTATGFEETELFETDEDAFQPLSSPDGKKVAFIGTRDNIRVYDRDSKSVTTVLDATQNYSYVDGDITFDWSPDSKWITADFASNGRLFFTNVAIVPADGSESPHDISLSGYTDTSPTWHESGGIIYWYSARYGQRDHGSHGTQFDIYASFLNKDAWDKFKANKEELALKKEADAEAEKAKKDDEKEDDTKDSDKKDAEKVTPIAIEWDKIEDRQARLTIHSSNLGTALLSKDADKLYYLSSFEGGYDLWVHDFLENETKKLLPLGADRASMTLSEDGKTLFLLADGAFKKVDTKSGKPEGIKVSADQTIRASAERRYLFEHIWRQVNDKFYRPGFHGQDWDAMRRDYAKKVDSTSNNRDFARLMEEMLGELNGSHTGAYYRGGNGGTSTAALGLLFENGSFRVTEVLEDSPVLEAEKTVAAGMTLTAINGTKLDATTNMFALLDGKAGERTRLTFKPEDGEAFDIVVKPTSLRDEADMMYDRWVESRRKLVEELSGGRLGYVHVPRMADNVYRSVYRDMFGRYMNAEALVVDTRNNRGGDLTNDLIKLLDGKQYMTNMPRGRKAQGEPLTQWTKPSIVLMNEGNYSDGHCFPAGFAALGMGKTVGMPVPGTCSYVWWERLMTGDLVFGIPQMGILDTEGDWMENKQLEPDVKVKNMPGDVAAGKDAQLEAAVRVMLEDLDTAPKSE
ncbi:MULTISPECIES: S41 family peptidase [Kordiimonas]|jgi:Tol biopolymer transport system component/C-terminal processing protease CtpA/Prc|uniref:S41 family peptidase n=1 Tax=Kordiimonas TaxID=288021 RepID=UPI00257BB13A|nr:S41 family peptidase [Kordiimonas sp. UBA4487]